jgi:hypothetical protein
MTTFSSSPARYIAAVFVATAERDCNNLTYFHLKRFKVRSGFRTFLAYVCCCFLRILVDLVIYDSRKVSLEHLLLSRHPSQMV